MIKEEVESTLKEALDWLDENQTTEKKDYVEKLKKVEAVCNPVIEQVYEKTSGSYGGDKEEDDSLEEL